MSTVNHPSHYNQISGIECIDVVENFTFNVGNAIKYLWRAGLKHSAVEDLEKAAWYCQREIERIKNASNNACTGQLAGAGEADSESTPSANCQ